MKLATGTCEICKKPIHLTRNYGWVHTQKEKVDHRAVLKDKEINRRGIK